MSNRAGAITVTLFSLVLISGVVGFAVYSNLKTEQKAQPKTNTSSVLQASDTGQSSLNVTSSSAVPLGNLPGENTGQNQSKTAGDTIDNNPGSSTTRPTVNPSTFKEYEKYKDAKSALFGDIGVGSGKEVTKGTTVAVNYRGWLTNGTVFDENTSPTKPLVFKVGDGAVISGFEQGVLGMKVGGERLVIIPPAAGYGALSQGSIPGNSILVFDITLLEAQ